MTHYIRLFDENANESRVPVTESMLEILDTSLLEGPTTAISCMHSRGGYGCTRPHGHDAGRPNRFHVAHGSRTVAVWWDSDPRSPKEPEQPPYLVYTRIEGLPGFSTAGPDIYNAALTWEQLTELLEGYKLNLTAKNGSPFIILDAEYHGIDTTQADTLPY